MLRNLMMVMKKAAVSVTYATWDPANKGSNLALASGNLTVNNSGVGSVRSTLGKSSGKWYWEITIAIETPNDILTIGIATSSSNVNNYVGGDGNGWSWASNANKYTSGSGTAYGVDYAFPQIIGVALDMDAGTLTFYRNNASQGVAFTGLTGTIFACTGAFSTSTSVKTNFGATALTYSPPAGFNAGLYV